MALLRHQSAAKELWSRAEAQHGVVSRAQLLAAGLTVDAIAHRVSTGRLHRTGMREVYAVGRPTLSRHGDWMAAVLACGFGAVLSHGSAAGLWDIAREPSGRIELSVPGGVRNRPGVVAHRRSLADDQVTCHQGIPVTSPELTLIDLATRLGRESLETAVNKADMLDLVDPETLRASLADHRGRRGVARLRTILDRRTFVLTDSQLERRFLPLARQAGLDMPVTGTRINGFKVDFYWPELKLVVETDGLRYHRTPAQQTRDRLRDQTHLAAGLTCLRFTHDQVRFEPNHVVATLRAVAAEVE